MATSWYVLRTNPRAEYLAAAQLESDGFEIIFPRVKSPHNRVGHADLPLFSGYLFLRRDVEADGWPSFGLRHCVAGWVSFEGVVPPIPDEVIVELAHRVEGINTGKGLWRRFRKGEKVRVASHGLDSLGEVLQEAKTPQASARVLLQFMGRMVQAQVPWWDLRPVQDEPGRNHKAPRRTRGGRRWIRGYGPAAVASGVA